MRRLLMVAGIALALARPGLAQTADEKAVQSYVEDVLLRLGDHKLETLDADFTPKALVVVARERDGKWTNNYQTAEEWLAGIRKNPNPTTFREPLSNVKVTIDSGQLAFLRADFQVVRDGKAVSSGVDEFTLVREDGRWRIALIAYTSAPVK
jgi:hypothetical protein